MLAFELHQQPLRALPLQSQIAARGTAASDDRKFGLLRIRTRLVFPELLDEGLEPHQVKEIYLTGSNEPDAWVDSSDTIDLKIEALREHKSQVGEWSELEQTIRGRAAEMAKGQDFSVAEGFKYFKLRE